MNHVNKPDDLTEGWPDEPAKAEVETFAGDLQGILPELPPEAMQRIGGRMHDEMTLQRWRKSIRRFVVVGALAASLLIAFGIWRAVDSSDQSKLTSNNQIAVRVVPTVHDHYRVPVMATPVVDSPDSVSLLPTDEQKRIGRRPLPRNDDLPLVPLENHRNLFTND